MEKRKVTFVLMFVVVCIWGLDYSIAKGALEVFEPLNLMFLKYAGGLLTITVIKLFTDREFRISKKDIIFFVMCSFTGQILYYFCEYSAITYIPVSLITIVLAFVPAVSIIIERIVFKRRFSAKITGGIIVCIIGVALVIGADFRVLLQGRAIGYLLAFGAVLSWNAYNFLTAKISKSYASLTMAFNQVTCTVLISAPYALSTMPALNEITFGTVGRVVYLGIVSAGIGYLIYIRGIRDLGPTVASMFSNLLPVTSTFFGWLILGQSIEPLQIAGGVVVVLSSFIVINEKGRLDRIMDREAVKAPWDKNN